MSEPPALTAVAAAEPALQVRHTAHMAFTTGARADANAAASEQNIEVRIEPHRAAAGGRSGGGSRSASQHHSHNNKRSSEDDSKRNDRDRSPSSSPDSARSGGSDSHKERRRGSKVQRTSPSDGFKGKYAVEVKGVCHSFGGKKGKLILDHLDLSIPMGTIYGLLGPSGCGKTTLIKCLLANLTPREGSVVIFGETPGSGPRSEVPGHDVGYMPQEIALYDEFTVYQNLHFYAHVHGMSNEEFESRAHYLCKLLDLKEPKSKNAGKLSGGQQRRASLACGLLHSPKLLILDEPTVGVDPTLRTKIWKYLQRISKQEGTTVLLTTHYIEEARKAHKVGLMREGKMLRQGTPKEIMRATKSKTLEQAFLKICKKDEKKSEKKDRGSKNDPEDSSSASSSDDDEDDDEDDDAEGDGKGKKKKGAKDDDQDEEDEDDLAEADAANEAGDDDEAEGEGADGDSDADGGEDDKDKDNPAASPSAKSDPDGASPNAVDESEDKDASSSSGSSKKTKRKARPSKSSNNQPTKASFADIGKDDLHEHLLAGERGASSPVLSSGGSPHGKAGRGKKGGGRHLQSPIEQQSGYHHDEDFHTGNGTHGKDGVDRDGSGRNEKKGKELTGCDKVMSALALPRWHQLWGLCWKNLMRMVKGIAAMIFQFVLPSIQVILFCVAIGKDPQHIHFGVVDQDASGPLFGSGVHHSMLNMGEGGLRANGDVMRIMHGLGGLQHPMITGGDSTSLLPPLLMDSHVALPDAAAAAHKLMADARSHRSRSSSSASSSYSLSGSIRRLLSAVAPSVVDPPPDPSDLAANFLSADFIGNLRDHFVVQSYDSEAAARDAVSTNAVWGYVSIPCNYTINTLLRLNQSMFAPLVPLSPDILSNSTLRYTLDMSNEQMTIYLVKSLGEAYTDLVQKWAPQALEQSPLQMETPVYGDADASFTDFVAPGIIITIAFSGSIGLTAITFVLDKKTGNLDRIWSTGTRASEIMLAQVLTQLIIFVVQIGLLLIFGLLVFKLPLKGSVVLLFGICILLGITGMMFGLVIASKVSEERDAMQAALGSFFPALLLSGVMWPVEAIPMPLYQIALGLPTTWAAEAGRSIMSRGWGIEHRQVWLGIVVPLAWSAVFFVWAARSLRPKQ